MYDSFSESKEGSSHGGLRAGAVEAKGGLSQLLSNAAHTLQGRIVSIGAVLHLGFPNLNMEYLSREISRQHSLK